MPFQFSLAAVLRYRQNMEEQQRLRLQSLYAAQTRLLHELRQTVAARRQAQRTVWSSLQEAPMPAANVQLCAAACDGLEQRQQQLQLALQRLQAEISAQVERYQQERRHRKVLESLRDLRLHEYRVEQRHREQAATDELFLLRRFAGEA
jgi:flagellar export protein FliJ